MMAGIMLVLRRFGLDSRRLKLLFAALALVCFALIVRPSVRTLALLLRFSGRGAATANSLEGYPEARCLDGTPGRYYFRPGFDSGRSKFLIFFEGGGFCSSHDDCAGRARTHLGSTRDDGAELSRDHPFFAASPSGNPLLWNWNHVLVRYCDGAYFSGYRRDPVKVAGHALFYRGQRITEAVFADLARYKDFRNATDVVLSGCSAGAIRVFAHADALRALVPSAIANVVGFADSGFYLDRAIFTPLKHFVIAGQNATGLMNSRCLADNRGREERCLIAAVVAPYLSTPIFAWQSRYDTDQRTCEMSRECAADPACVRSYGDDLAREISVRLPASRGHGVFLDSCDRHCACPRLPVDDASRVTPTQAFADWHTGGRGTFGQDAPFPCPSCCGT